LGSRFFKYIKKQEHAQEKRSVLNENIKKV